jgi:hypothetical protein
MPNYLDGTLRHTRVLVGIHVRGHKNAQAKCVGAALDNKTFPNRKAVQDALAEAARVCGGKKSRKKSD